jgi:hypothetical protein
VSRDHFQFFWENKAKQSKTKVLFKVKQRLTKIETDLSIHSVLNELMALSYWQLYPKEISLRNNWHLLVLKVGSLKNIFFINL